MTRKIKAVYIVGSVILVAIGLLHPHLFPEDVFGVPKTAHIESYLNAIVIIAGFILYQIYQYHIKKLEGQVDKEQQEKIASYNYVGYVNANLEKLRDVIHILKDPKKKNIKKSIIIDQLEEVYSNVKKSTEEVYSNVKKSTEKVN